MNTSNRLTSRPGQLQIATRNKLIANTYKMVVLSLVVSAISSLLTLNSTWPVDIGWWFLGGAILLMVGIFAFKESGVGILFALTFAAWMGALLGPLFAFYGEMPNGHIIVCSSILITACIFGSLSIYVHKTKTNFSFLGGFLFVGLSGLVLVSLADLFLGLNLEGMVTAYIGIIVFSGYILFDTSLVIQQGEDNYIIIALDLYLDIVCLFLRVLQVMTDKATDAA